MIFFGKAKLDIIAGRNEPIETWCTKHGYDKNYSSKSNFKIHHLSRKLIIKKFSLTLKETTVKQHLKNLQFKYLIAWIYKTIGNASLLCLWFYALVTIFKINDCFSCRIKINR